MDSRQRDDDELRIRGIVRRPLLGAMALADLHGRRYDPSHPDALVRHLPGKHNQLTHGRPGIKGAAKKLAQKLAAAVRPALADAVTSRDVGRAASVDARRITGRDIGFDFGDSDPQIAREHAEGVLRGLERYPKANFTRVRTGEVGEDTEEAYAGARHDGSGWEIVLSADAQRYGADAYRTDLRNDAAEGYRRVGTPEGVALHEFGHVVANQYNLNSRVESHAKDYVKYILKSTDFKGSVAKHVSRYATTNSHELVAEAFSDVMVNGDQSSGLSQDIVNMLDAAIRRVEG